MNKNWSTHSNVFIGGWGASALEGKKSHSSFEVNCYSEQHCWLRHSSCQHYLEERVFFFPTQEAYYLDDLRGQSRTSLGAPNFATADAVLWVHCAETIPERPFLPQCVHTYMIIVWNLKPRLNILWPGLKPISFLLRFVCLFGLLLFKQLHAVGQKLITLSSLQNAETTPERPFLPQCVHIWLYIRAICT